MSRRASQSSKQGTLPEVDAKLSHGSQIMQPESQLSGSKRQRSRPSTAKPVGGKTISSHQNSQMVNIQEHLPEIHASTSEHMFQKGRTANPLQMRTEPVKTPANEAQRSSSAQGLAPITISNEKGSRFGFEVLDYADEVHDNTHKHSMPKSSQMVIPENANRDIQFHLPQKLEELDATQVNFTRQAAINYDRRTSGIVINKTSSQLAQQDLQMIQSKINNLVITNTTKTSPVKDTTKIAIVDQEKKNLVEEKKKSDVSISAKQGSIPSAQKAKESSQQNSKKALQMVNMPQSQNPKKYVRKTNKNMFKEREMSDHQVIELLAEVSESRVIYSSDQPHDLDSTDPLDSFLMALLEINNENAIDPTSLKVKQVHLATGDRTNICRQILLSLVQHQYKEFLLTDSVEFFSDSLQKMVVVNETNKLRMTQIEQLEETKQELTMKMFDYQKKLTDTSTSLLKLRQTSYENTKIIDGLKKQLEFKKAECESLTYMLQNNQPGVALHQQSLKLDTNRITPIKTITTPLESEIFPEEPPGQESAEVDSLQGQIQRLQIQLKQYLNQIKQQHNAIESKDRLITHLENNIATFLVEREENVIKLKSEIVLLQTKVNNGEITFKERLLQMRGKVEAEEKKKIQSQIDELNKTIDSLKNMGADQLSRIQRLQADYNDLKSEFKHYRSEKTHQEEVRESYLKETEGKYTFLSQNYQETKSKLTDNIQELQSKLKVKQNEAEVSLLRLKYLRQCTETLQRQKIFVLETLQKSKQDLRFNMAQIQESMINQNKSKSYLISVEKAIKQTQGMQEMGVNALKSFEQIITFFKTEKMYELVFQVEPPQASIQKNDETVNTLDAKVTPAVNTSPLGTLIPKPEVNSVQLVQKMLDTLKNKIDVPVNFRPKKIPTGQQAKKVVKNEEYYLDHCPLEMVSILLKFLVEQLAQLEIVQSVEQIPFSISRLLFLANSKSDLQLEKELFEIFLQPTKKLLDDEYQQLLDQIVTHNALIVFKDNRATEMRLSPVKSVEAKQEEILLTEESQRAPSKAKTYNILSMEAFESKGDADTVQNIAAAQEKIITELSEIKKQLEFELSKAQITMEESKLRSKEIQKALACKVVQLEEDFEIMEADHEERLDQAEAGYRGEIERMKEGCRKREEELIENITNLRSRNLELEGTMQRAESTLINDDLNLKKGLVVAQSTTILKAVKTKPLGSLTAKKKVEEVVEGLSQEYVYQLEQLTNKFENMKDNIATFINIRESTRQIISLVFQASESNQAMINEEIIGFYLGKVYQLPKDKFNFLNTFDFVQDEASKRKEQVVMTQVTFEIMMEYTAIETQAASVRAAITDGSSLLYDLSPLYVCFNFGQSGLATHHKIRDFFLIKKQGMQLGNSEFLVSLFRHNQHLFVFMVVALDITDGNEYVVELLEQDIYQLSLGNLGLLEDDESSELQDLILDNLNLVELGNDKKLLTCEQKLFFNPIWQEAFVPKIYKDKNKITGKHDLTLKETTIKTSVYHQSIVREATIIQTTKIEQHQFKDKPKNNQIYSEVGQQTETHVSGFGEFEQVYSGIQQVSQYVTVKLEIKESHQGNVLMMEFQETKSNRTAKFCIFKQQVKNASSLTVNSVEESDEMMFMLNPDSKQSFYCHSQCILIDQGHIILVCVEKIQNEGLQIRLHDLKMCSSEQFFLIKKSNGQLSKLPQQTDASKLLIQEDFRNIIYDLSFVYIAPDNNSDIVLQKINYAQEKMMAEGKDPRNSELFVQNSNEAKELKKIDSLSIQALKSDHTIFARHSNQVEYQNVMQERGMLLYRDVVILRMSDQSLSEEDIKEGRFNEKKSMISLYLKNQQINIEVFFYSDDQKMSIIGSVDALDLFQNDPQKVPFAERVNFISQMLDRLFVNEEQGGKFILKVESDMPPMSQILLQRQSEPGFEKMGLQTRMSPHAIDALKRTQSNAQKNYEDKLLEFENEKERYIENEKAKKFQIYGIVGQKNGNVPAGANSGLTLQLNIYVLLKKEKKGKNLPKRLNTYGKTQMQIEHQKLEAYMDDHIEIDQIYIETRDPATGNLINTIIDKRKLIQILVCDFTIDWVELLVNWRSQLITYIQQNIEIDIEKSLITIRNKSDTSNLLVSYCKSVVGSKMEQRGNNAIIDTFPDESRELLNRQLLLNQEVDFTEYSYDIKLYKISKKSAYGEGVLTVGIETLAYHLEIFNLNEPDVVFKFRLPVTASKSNDPVSVFIEVMNLTDFANQKKEISNNIQQSNQELTNEMNRREVLLKNKDEQSDNSARSELKTFERKSDVKVPASKFQELFKRYVDNQLVLVVQENKFPALISIALLEPSSRLCQKCTFEPTYEISQPARFSLIDGGDLENFFSQVYDSTSDEYNPSFEGTEEQDIDWNSIKDTKPHQLMKSVFLSPDFKLKIQKHRGNFIVQVKDSKKEKLWQAKIGTDQIKTDPDLDPKMQTSVNSEQDEEAAEAIYNVQTLHGKYFQDPDCLSDSINILDIRIKDVFKIQMISKVLYCHDSSGQTDRSLIFLIETNRTMISVTVKNLLTSTTVFCLKLNHSESQQTELPAQVIKSLSQVRPSLLDAIGLLNTAHIAEEAAKRHNKPNQDHAGPRKRKIGLHRKVLFDDVLEKLIVITAEIEVTMGIQKCEPGLLDQDIDFFSFKVFEPERDFSETIAINLSELVGEREFASLNRRDLSKLKSVAKDLLEDRAVIQRVEEENYSPSENKADYYLQFKAQKSMEESQSTVKGQVSSKGKVQEQQQRKDDQARVDTMHSIESQLRNYQNMVILELDEETDR